MFIKYCVFEDFKVYSRLRAHQCRYWLEDLQEKQKNWRLLKTTKNRRMEERKNGRLEDLGPIKVRRTCKQNGRTEELKNIGRMEDWKNLAPLNYKDLQVKWKYRRIEEYWNLTRRKNKRKEEWKIGRILWTQLHEGALISFTCSIDDFFLSGATRYFR